MQRKLVLWVLAGAAVWVGALLDFGPRQQSPAAPAESHPAPMPQPPAASHARRLPANGEASEQAAAPEAPEARAPAPAPAATSAVSSLVRAFQGTVAVIGEAAGALLTRVRRAVGGEPPRPAAQPAPRATGELGEGVLSPDYADAEHRFASEARDGSWAPAEEDRLRALLERQPWSDRVSLLNCQRSICRIVLETGAQDPWQQLLGVPGLRAATGIAPNTPYSLRSGQLSVYFTPPDGERTAAN